MGEGLEKFDVLEAASIPIECVEELIGHSPTDYFYIKDAALRYVAASRSILNLCGVANKLELIGRTAADFFRPDDALLENESDARVMRTRVSLLPRLEVCSRPHGVQVWLLRRRWPVAAADQAPWGVACLSRQLARGVRGARSLARVFDSVRRMSQGLERGVSITGLSEAETTSRSQLNRDFLSIFGITPQAYMSQLRIELACDLLLNDVPITSVAHSCGYSDQSAFTRRFSQAMGMTPFEYRRSSETFSKFNSR